VSGIPDDIVLALDSLARRRPDIDLDVRWLSTVGSTMDVVASLAAAGSPEGIVVGADEQSSGRGRRGHTWQSPPGAGLYFSWLCRPGLAASALPLVTLAAGVGVHRGIRQATGLSTDLKWPNDILMGERKVAGILAEGCSLGSSNQSVIIGVGLNLRHANYPAEVASRATSLEVLLGRPPERGPVFVEILSSLVDCVAAVARGHDGILRAWRDAAPSAVGTRVEWTDATETRRGTTAGIDDDGALLIRTADTVERVVAGEVRWLANREQRTANSDSPCC
jgi:BirA family biotin operon repressor/biotin-[acetyl-CoA-carboxylase] ligase